MDNKTTITQSPWIADIPTMTCRHTTNNMILQFTKEGKSLKPEIKEMPKELLTTIAKNPSNLSHLQDLIDEGKAIFLRAYFETQIDNGEPPK
ncbi:hypothetical protein AGMMS50268_33300 [Spirochaetia bacterium]|nr:hypothetical protein AGMMS50268_33300 [Spirochaetia bacterium]